MKVGSDKGDSGDVKGPEGPPKASGPGQTQGPSNSEFNQALNQLQQQRSFEEVWQGAGRAAPPPRREPGPAEPKKKDDKKKKKDPKEGPASKLTKKPAQMGGQIQQIGSAASQVGGAEKGGTGTSVDKILAVFENHSVMGSTPAQISVSQTGAVAQISVTLQNGVMVNVSVGAGGKDLNLEIHGISANAQKAMDDPENQMFLRAKLAEQGFKIHKLETFRGEGPATLAPPPTEPKMATTETQEPPPGEGEEGDGGEEEEEER